MKNLYCFPILAGLIFLNLSVSAQNNQAFSIEEIRVRIYDNEKDTVVQDRTNPYGNGMNTFLSIKLKQVADSEKTYTIKVEGFGKGRENEAEGFVEDYKINTQKEIKVYSDTPLFIPFILDFPCVDETNYIVTVTQKETGKKITKAVKTKLGWCYLN